jgi:cytochrome oxidase Cu insertion factor (SCO1/SenC/PrrC family)
MGGGVVRVWRARLGLALGRSPGWLAARIALAAVAVGAASSAAVAHDEGMDGDPASPSRASAPRYEAPAPGSYELPPIDRVSEHELLDTNGEPATLPGIGPGEAALVSFVYLSCGEACPLATATLHRLDRMLAADPELARRVLLATVSFDPERDTPERMRELSEQLDPRGRWVFLTAAGPAALRPVLADFGQDAVWIPGGEKAPDRLRHVLKIFLVDADRRVRNIYSTGLMDVRLVLNDLRTVLAETPADDGP